MLAACSMPQPLTYRDITALEQPPLMAIASSQVAAQDASQDATSAPGKTPQSQQTATDILLLAGSASVPTITIKQPLTHAWELVEHALDSERIEIEDANRTSGIFYLLFDPNQQFDQPSLIGWIATFFVDYAPHRMDYQLMLVWRDGSTEVTAQRLHPAADNAASEVPAATVDHSALLITRLYKTLKHNMRSGRDFLAK